VTIVSTSALRLIACAGALATGLLFGGAGAGIAIADPDESAPAGADGATTAGNVETPAEQAGGGGGDDQPEKEPPTSTVGNGREDIDQKPVQEEANEGEKKPGVGNWPNFKHSLSIPVLRVPTQEELTAAGWVDPALFFGTVDVPVPSIDGFLSALSQPEPEPTPSPAFRTQQEAPVIDVTGGGSGGAMAAENNNAPPVFELPLVVAPTVPVPGVAVPSAPRGTSSASDPPMTASAPTAAAGTRAPVISGSISPKAEPAATNLTPTSGQATRVAYPRFLRNPTVGQLAIVALPGIGGLMFLTFSGGVIGYRQANSIRFIRTAGAERFLE
jgi:hypothetical protein